ncbi:peptidase M23 [Streptomyces longispororuber]|uniref:Peptidase M23 n=1 Tax=Streptomyces longispororuber TaxID=68230 RepID=A0A918ZYH5_9ACTN|nr:M23 family metallopeptidase [Streptomyces longispororuber]GHE74989.1 peptidase M23 [Streptomyces longispororuber]
MSHAHRPLSPALTLAALALLTLLLPLPAHAAPGPPPLIARANPGPPPSATRAVAGPPPFADGSGAAPPAVGGVWPVGLRPLVVRGWEPPATAYGPGHRGVDLAAPPGSAVRAVAPGRVSFAGRVAGRGVIAVELRATGNPPLRTTYEPVRPSVRKGTEVTTGDVLGTVEPTARYHCPTPCLHWGLRRADTYLNPLGLLPPWLLGGGPSRLLPLGGGSGALKVPWAGGVQVMEGGRWAGGGVDPEPPRVPDHTTHHTISHQAGPGG